MWGPLWYRQHFWVRIGTTVPRSSWSSRSTPPLHFSRCPLESVATRIVPRLPPLPLPLSYLITSLLTKTINYLTYRPFKRQKLTKCTSALKLDNYYTLLKTLLEIRSGLSTLNRCQGQNTRFQYTQ